MSRSATAGLIGIEDVRQAARRRLPRFAFDFIEGGAGDETTADANLRAFHHWVFLPQYLRDVEHRDQSVSVLGARLRTPVVLGPAGLQRIAHLEGEVAAARAAKAAGTVFVVGSRSSRTLEDVVAAAGADTVWFQLYLLRDRGRTQELLDRARDAGIRTLVVTVDAPVLGNRERDLRNGFSIPLRLRPRTALGLARHPRWAMHAWRGGPIGFANDAPVDGHAGPAALSALINGELAYPSATIADLEWIRERWRGPLVIKGTMTGEDAADALAAGVDGICVSNHGGRQLDGAAATLEVLPAVVEAVGGRAAVFVDGGVRRGSDVVKALVLGADAVWVVRPYLYGLAVDGERGALAAIEILKREVDLTLALLGRPVLADLDAGCLARAPHGTGVPTGLSTYRTVD